MPAGPTWKKEPESGYKMQRYEVRAKQPEFDSPRYCELTFAHDPHVDCDGSAFALVEFVVGWTEQEDGGSLVKMVNAHPTWRDPRVVDLGEDMWSRMPNQKR
jgi:hypothetical protein